MKITILKNNLKNSLDAVSRTVGENTNLPILKNILVKADNGKINIISTDLEMAVIKTVAGKIVEGGQFTVPFGVFNSVINNIQSERIDLENKNTNILIKTDSYEAMIQGMNPEDFPIIPIFEKKKEFMELKGDILKDSLGQVVSAAQTSELRPEISGVLLDMDGGMFKLVATDSFRLAEKIIYNSDSNNGFKIIIPLKPAQELIRIIDNKDNIRFYADESQFMAETEDLLLITKLIDGKFPDYAAIIPKNVSTEAEINRSELIGALKLVSSFTSKNNEVVFRVIPDRRMVEIYSADSMLGENKYLIPAKINGEAVEVSFNWRFFLDGLKNIGADSVYIGFQGDIKPSVIKQPGDSSYIYILMPIKSS